MQEMISIGEREVEILTTEGRIRYMQSVANSLVLQGVCTLAVEEFPGSLSNTFAQVINSTHVKLNVQEYGSKSLVLAALSEADDQSIAVPIALHQIQPLAPLPPNSFLEALNRGEVNRVIDDVHLSLASYGGEVMMAVATKALPTI